MSEGDEKKNGLEDRVDRIHRGPFETNVSYGISKRRKARVSKALAVVELFRGHLLREGAI
jgi:hypothetical protein